jgi:DNA-binding NarL/FixJ family response regulator
MKRGQKSDQAEGATAIVCDDHPAFAKGLAKLLATEGFDVFGVAGSAGEAERMVRDMLPDLVFMDVRMPKTDGIEATRRIRAASPTTKVMILTVSDEESDLYWALRAGASGYVTKDKEISEIADSARAVLRGQLVIPADMAGRFLKDLEDVDPSALSATEREILAGIARGETNRDIGVSLNLSERTIRRRVEDVYQKLHLADRLEAAVYAAQRGLGAPVKEKQSGP